MADFERAFLKLLDVEGKTLTNNINDLGGLTKMGITLDFLKLIRPGATAEMLSRLSIGDVHDIYKTWFWDKFRVGEILNQAVAETVFEAVVNMDAQKAIKILQYSINRLTNASISEDGIMGSNTLSALNKLSQDAFLDILKYNLIKFYYELMIKIPSQKANIKGWLKRVILD